MMAMGNSDSSLNNIPPSSAPKKKMKTEGSSSSAPENSSSSSENKEEAAAMDTTAAHKTVAQAFWERRQRSQPRPSPERTVVPVVVSTPPDTSSSVGASISAPATRSSAALPATPSTNLPSPDVMESNQDISGKSSPSSAALSSCPTGTRTAAATATTSLPSRSIGERKILTTPQSLPVPTAQPQTNASPLAIDGNPATEPTGDRMKISTPAGPTPKREDPLDKNAETETTSASDTPRATNGSIPNAVIQERNDLVKPNKKSGSLVASRASSSATTATATAGTSLTASTPSSSATAALETTDGTKALPSMEAAATDTNHDRQHQPDEGFVSPLTPRRFPKAEKNDEEPRAWPKTFPGKEADAYASTPVATEATDGLASSSSSSSLPSPATPLPLSEMAIENQLNDIDNNDYVDNADDDDCNSLDRIATRAEETFVLRELLQIVETAEHAATHNTTKLHPSLPTTAITPLSVPAFGTGGNAGDSAGLISALGTWKTPPRPGPHPQVPFWGRRCVLGRKRSSSSKPRTDSRVRETIEISRQKVQQSLPKWIPDESGRYPNDDDSSSLLFTRPQFVERVVLETEQLIRGLEWEHQIWTATLSDHHPKDPHSYLLEAEGTDEAMDILRVTTEIFVREEIGRRNLERLLGDGASLVVDVNWVINLRMDLARQVLGACFSSIRTDQAHTEGIYIRSVDPMGALAKHLGGPEIFNNGCALLAVNKTKVSELSEVQDLIMQAKSQSTRAQSKTKIKLSLCLSKYADLSEARNVSKLKIHRRDGLPYDEEDYETFRFHRYIESTQKQPINQAKILSEDNEGSQSSVDDLTVSKKRRNQGKIISKKKTKRRKQIRKEVLSDTDGESDTTDTANVTVMDEDFNEKEKSKLKRTRMDGYAIFQLFEQKMKPLVILDYKDTRIYIKSVCSSMWKKHKEIFGEKVRCGDDCKCLMWLPDMVENVIKDHIERPRKKNVAVESEEELEKNTCGIIKNFVPKFIHLLQDEYPTETETQLVKRLVGMWESHQKNRMYGMRCQEGCGCQGEWDQIFGKGDKPAAMEFLSMMKRSSLMSQSMASSDFRQVTTCPVVPRKKRALPSSNAQSSVENNIQSKKSKSVGLISSMSSRVNIFEVPITSSIPIGGYFKTRKNQCKVFSIYLKGQMAKEPRIQNGTKVLSVKTGRTHIAISSHTELQKFYEDARRTGSLIHISFDNSGAKPNSASDKRLNDIVWNDSGQWVGTANLDEDDGWAGGSAIAPRPEPAKKAKEKKQNVQTTASKVYTTKSILTKFNLGADVTVQDIEGRKTSQKNTNNLNTEGRNEDNLNVAEWTTIINTNTPGHNIRVPKKNLIAKKSSFPAEEPGEDRGLSKLMPAMMKRSRRERTHSKRVKFSIPNNEEYFFCKNEASNVGRVLQMKFQANSNKMSQQALTNALRNGSCNDLIDILEAQEFQAAESVGDFDLEAVLQKEYTLIGNKLKTFNESDEHKRMASQKNDLSAKYRVLSIYISCIHLIERTMAVKEWYVLTIVLKYIALQQNHSIVDAIGGNVSVKLQDENVKEDFSPLPVKSFAQHISYIDESLEYTLHNNKNFLFEQRSFVIDLKKGSLQDSNTGGRTLGSFKLELNNIENMCLPDDKPSEFTKELTNHSVQELSSGLVTINAYKKGASKEYIMLKKQEIIEKLKLQLEYIDRFNQDPKNPPGARLTANIFGLGGKSILHAAVVLVDDKVLVEKMLRLGANPRSSMNTRIGTPLSLAQRNFHSAVEREKIMRGRGMDAEPRVQRCNQAMMIVEMLQKNIIEPPVAISRAIPRNSLGEMEDDQLQSGGKHIINAIWRQTHYQNIELPAAMSRAIPKNSLGEMEDDQSQSGGKHISMKSHQRSSFTSAIDKVPKTAVSSALNKSHTNRCLDQSLSTPRKKQKRLDQPTPVIGRFDRTLLPTMQNRCWVSLAQSQKSCQFGDASCRFFKQHICRYWHNAPAPLPHKQPMMPIPPSGNELSNLLKMYVEFEKHFAFDKVEWWTAAYVHPQLHTVIYVWKVLMLPGRIGKNGVVWFATKAEAYYSLRYTVFLYQKYANSHKPAQHHQTSSEGFHNNPNHSKC